MMECLGAMYIIVSGTFSVGDSPMLGYRRWVEAWEPECGDSLGASVWLFGGNVSILLNA